ncbi:MAG: lysostaphin resistance A-like protein, partial [Bacteroidota bacterium]
MADVTKLDGSKSNVIFLIRGQQLFQFCAFIVSVYICTYFFSHDKKEYLNLRAPSDNKYFIAGVALMLIAIPFSAMLGQINRSISLPYGIENWMKEKEAGASWVARTLLLKHSVKDLLLNIFFIAGLAAVGEELLFRSLAQRLLIKLFKSPWAGIIVSAAIFSAMHMQFYGFLPRFALGVILGAIYWYSGSLWVAILAHFIYDTVLVVLAYFNPEMLNDENNIQLANLAVLGTISLALVILLVVWMKKRSTASYNTVYGNDAVPVKDHPF